MADIEQLDRALKWIDENPNLHDQRIWFEQAECGTACCLAGTVAMLNGWQPVFGTEGVDQRVTGVVTDGTLYRPVQEVAQELLRIDRYDANHLFCSGNTVERLKRLRDWLSEESDFADE